MKAIGFHTYQLDIPEGTPGYNLVHTTPVKRCRRQDDPQNTDENKEEMSEVEQIVNSSRVKEVT